MTDERPMIKRIDSVHDISVTDLVDWCHQRGLSPDEVRLSGGHLKWESPQTDAEKARSDEYHAASIVRHVEWEKATYKRLKEIYGPAAE